MTSTPSNNDEETFATTNDLNSPLSSPLLHPSDWAPSLTNFPSHSDFFVACVQSICWGASCGWCVNEWDQQNQPCQNKKPPQ